MCIKQFGKQVLTRFKTTMTSKPSNVILMFFVHVSNYTPQYPRRSHPPHELSLHQHSSIDFSSSWTSMTSLPVWRPILETSLLNVFLFRLRIFSVPPKRRPFLAASSCFFVSGCQFFGRVCLLRFPAFFVRAMTSPTSAERTGFEPA